MINGAGGNIRHLLSIIKAAVVRSAAFKNVKNVTDDVHLDHVMKNSAIHRIAVIKAKSPILQKMAQRGETKIAGAYCNFTTGEVKFFK